MNALATCASDHCHHIVFLKPYKIVALAETL